MTHLDVAITDWLMHLRVEKGSSPHTLSNYQRDIERWRDDLENKGVIEITDVKRQHVHDHISALSQGSLTGAPAAASSVSRALSAIRSFHRFAVREGIASIDPTTGIHPPRLGSHLPKALSIDEVATLLDVAHKGDSPEHLRDAALLELLYATGARVSEAISMSVDDVDLDAELPVVRFFGKGRKERLVPVGSYARDAISAYLVRGRPVLASRGKGTHYLFLGSRGAQLSRQGAFNSVQRIAQEADLDAHVSPHTLRHSFATHLLEGGASVRDVQELLGHASVQTTQIYTRITALTLREVHRTSHPRAQH